MALWPGQPDLVGEKCRSLALAPGVCPALILEVVSENTGAAEARAEQANAEITRLRALLNERSG